MKTLKLFFIVLILSGCNSKNHEPYLHYSAKFDDSRINEVENILLKISIENKLKIFKKDRDAMKYISKNEDAFFAALYFKNDPVLILTNVGVANTIILTATDYGEMSKVELDKIVRQLLDETKAELGINWLVSESLRQ